MVLMCIGKLAGTQILPAQSFWHRKTSLCHDNEPVPLTGAKIHFFKGQLSLQRKWQTTAIAELLCCRIPLADGVRLSEYLHTHTRWGK